MLQPTLTQSGINLMIKALCGGEIQFTKLKIGNGSAEGIDIKTLTDLINPIKNINISRMDRNDNNVILVGTGYDNSEVESDITWNEVGVYATDPDEGEILFAYVNTENALEIIKSNRSGVSIENNLSVMLIISSDITISAVITSIQYASKQDLLEHIKLRNPHGLTKEDIDLGNVENKVISEQSPEFETGLPLTNIKKGDTIKTITSKIWSAIKLLAEHIANGDNPHGTNADDINKSGIGIISEERGGTGFNSLNDMLNALGLNNLQLESHYHNSEGGSYIFLNKMYIEWGKVPVNADAYSIGESTITYPKNYFAAVPMVFNTIYTEKLNRHCAITKASRSGFTIVLQNNTNVSITNNINYLVIGYLTT